MTTESATPTLVKTTLPVSQLQGEAWAMWNASYHAPDREAYRVVSRALYQQDVHDRVSALFARSDEQNARIDAMLRRRARRKR